MSLTVASVTSGLLLGLSVLPTVRTQDPRPAERPESVAADAPQFVRSSAVVGASVLTSRGGADEVLAVVRDLVVDTRTGSVTHYVAAAREEERGEDGTARDPIARRVEQQAVEVAALEWERGEGDGPVGRSRVTAARFTASPKFDLASLRDMLARKELEERSERARTRPKELTESQLRDALATAGRNYRTAGGLRGLEVRAADRVLGKVRGLVLHLDRHRVAFAVVKVEDEEVLVPWAKLQVETRSEGPTSSTFVRFDGDPERIADAPREGETAEASLDRAAFRAALLRHFGVASTEGR